MECLEAQRHFFADLVTASAGVPKDELRLASAFASTPREDFLGPGPWKVFVGGRYIETPSPDPAFLYQDVVVGLAPDRRINNGQPVLHAICLAALGVKEGDTVVHVGAGTGYYRAARQVDRPDWIRFRLRNRTGPRRECGSKPPSPNSCRRSATLGFRRAPARVRCHLCECWRH